MTYTRVRNQQLSITFKPVSPSSDTLFSHSKELFKDIESLLKEKHYQRKKFLILIILLF